MVVAREVTSDKFLPNYTTPNTGRFDLIDQLIEEYRPDCVIDLIWQACLTYDIESTALRTHIQEKHDLPTLKIETDYSPSDSSRIAVRVQALLETAANRGHGT